MAVWLSSWVCQVDTKSVRFTQRMCLSETLQSRIYLHCLSQCVHWSHVVPGKLSGHASQVYFCAEERAHCVAVNRESSNCSWKSISTKVPVSGEWWEKKSLAYFASPHKTKTETGTHPVSEGHTCYIKSLSIEIEKWSSYQKFWRCQLRKINHSCTWIEMCQVDSVHMNGSNLSTLDLKKIHKSTNFSMCLPCCVTQLELEIEEHATHDHT